MLRNRAPFSTSRAPVLWAPLPERGSRPLFDVQSPETTAVCMVSLACSALGQCFTAKIGSRQPKINRQAPAHILTCACKAQHAGLGHFSNEVLCADVWPRSPEWPKAPAPHQAPTAWPGGATLWLRPTTPRAMGEDRGAQGRAAKWAALSGRRWAVQP